MSVFVERNTKTPTQAGWANHRVTERFLILGASVILMLGFISLFFAKKDSLERAKAGIERGTLQNLNNIRSAQDLDRIMQRLYPDERDQKFVAEAIAKRAHQGEIPNVGTLNKLKTTGREIEAKAGDGFKARLENSWRLLGLNRKLVEQERRNPIAFPSARDFQKGPFSISGTVYDGAGVPMPKTLVTLESAYQQDTLRTDASGRYAFQGLAANQDYNVLALKPNNEFKRVRFSQLRDQEEANFSAKPHTIRLIETPMYVRLKPQTVVRAPGDYLNLMFFMALGFISLFWIVHIVWSLKRFNGDPYILPVLMLLSGLGLLMMFAIPDPLRDLLRGFDTVLAIGAGALLMMTLAFIDVQRYGYDFSETGNRSFIWLGLAGLISLLLLTIGFGPEGSTARVNLHLFLFFGPEIQPVELIKFCLLIFFSGYLARKWQFIRQLDAEPPAWLNKSWIPRLPNLRALLPILFGVAFALGFFYLQKDLGPALVICTTFLVLYAVTRHHWAATGLGMLLLVLGFWVMYQLNPTVSSRISMWLSPWNNTADGGDHLAYSLWSLASGGWLGQGLGDGSPADTPAAHTDMILSAVGEELGFFGLSAVFLLYGVYFYRGWKIALETDSRFSFFLALGIVTSSAIQLLLIAGGAFGVMPLTGVVSPFLSYGKVAFVMHFVFAGILINLSAHQPKAEFKAKQIQEFGTPLKWTRYVLGTIGGIILLWAGYVQLIRPDEISLRPSLVMQSDGLKNYTYNPRLLRIRDALPLGNIFDRNGIPLATSDSTALLKFKTTYKELGYPIDGLVMASPNRYYPFQALTFYLLGDLNTRVKWNAPNGLYAENRYLSKLRGYDNRPEPHQVTTTLANGKDTTYTVVAFDYTPLLPFLHGADPKDADKIMNTTRDLKLAVDLRLQRKVADAIRLRAAQLNLSNKNISAVVMDAKSGDLLASVSYPLPQEVFTSPGLAQGKSSFFDHAMYASKAPGSTLKVATAMAAFRRGGASAQYWTALSDPSNKWWRYYREGEPKGTVTMEQAIMYSSNVYFATLATDRVGPEEMLAVLDRFGFTIKNPAYSQSQKLERLYANNFHNLAQAGFGQGEITGAPINVARMAAAVANRGKSVEPRFFLDGSATRVSGNPLITEDQALILREMMRKVVTQGTAKSLAGNPLPIAGKTGTAQQKGKPDHAWFVGFVPDGRGSALVVAVLVEESGRHGGDIAPIAGSIFDAAKSLGLIR